MTLIVTQNLYIDVDLTESRAAVKWNKWNIEEPNYIVSKQLPADILFYASIKSMKKKYLEKFIVKNDI